MSTKWHINPGSPSVVRDENDVIVADHCSVEDAKLIAAAPDLLETLKGVLRLADRNQVAFMAAHAAIAKAEGKK